MLTAAFNWLQSQPDSVRKLATTPDALVGLYLRAQRFGNSSFEADAPVSSQSFMSDLKNLAEGLKQFEEPPRQEYRSDLAHQPTQQQPQRRAPVQQQQHHQVAAPTYMPAPHPSQMPASPAAPSNFATREMALAAMTTILNDRSVAMIQEVKGSMNLSSDAEALNMMISLAYKSLKNLIV